MAAVITHIWDCGLVARWFHTRGGEWYAAARFAKFVKAASARANHTILACDPDGPTWRHAIFPAYKADREKKRDPEEYAKLIKQIVGAIRLVGEFATCLGAEGAEADDVIGTVSKRAIEAGHVVVVFSGDKDMAQLLARWAPLLRLHDGKQEVTDEVLKERFGIGSAHIADYLAIAGDHVDGIPGVPGLGPVAAVELISNHGSLSNALIAASNAFQAAPDTMPTTLRKLHLNADKAILSARLIELKYDVPLRFPWEN